MLSRTEFLTAVVLGHRPQYFDGFNERNNVHVSQVKSSILNACEKLYEMGIRRYITGMALGADTWGSESVLELKTHYSDIRLVAAIPFLGQKRLWNHSDRERYYSILQQCFRVVNVSGSSRYKKEYMQLRNEWMIDHSDYVVGVWNGKPSGTGNALRYARMMKKQIWIINPSELPRCS